MSDKEQKNNIFTWVGKAKNGKKTKGEMQATSAILVKAKLRKKGIIALKVKKKSDLFTFTRNEKIKPIDIAIFTRQLSTMMKAGIPLLNAFDITIQGMEKASMRDLLNKVKTSISEGLTLAEALRLHPKYFDDLFCSLIEAGEQSGSLDTILDRIATFKEKSEALKAKIKKAMNYPIAVLSISLAVTALLLIKVVPQFQAVFDGFGAELPPFTVFVINISDFVQKYWYMFIIMAFALFFTTRHALSKSPKLREMRDRHLLKLPIIGNLVTKSVIARFTRTLSTTFSSGVPLVDGLTSVAGATGNIIFYNATNQIKEEVSSGQQLHIAMKESNVFTSMTIQMVAIGEESGSLDEMLDKVATFYEDDVDNTVDGLTSLMEPIVMTVLGILIGGLIIAMYLPIFQLGSIM